MGTPLARLLSAATAWAAKLRAGQVLLGLALCFLPAGYSQTPGEPATVEERLASLESQFAILDTRLNARTTVVTGSLGSTEAGLAAQSRIGVLEREVSTLTREVRDLNRQVAAAGREAAAARREARDALSRIR